MLPHDFLTNLQKEQNKGFLYYLYTIKDTDKKRKRVRQKRILNAATHEEIDLLVDVLYYAANGLLPIKTQHFHTVKKSCKLPHFFNNFEDRTVVNKLKGEKKSVKVNTLLKLARFHELLFCLFNL